MPQFSIITPFYNRAKTIARAIESCLTQSLGDFELILVDDGSTDDSVLVASGYPDSRIQILRHHNNRGPCPARNAGIEQAKGQWFVMLDSDDALMPNALEVLSGRIEAAKTEIGDFASSCLLEDGQISPIPAVMEHPMGFSEYWHWVQTLTYTDRLHCFRRAVFDAIRYPANRAWEFEFHMDLTRSWQIEVTRDVLVRIHWDAENRLTAAEGKHAMERMLLDAPDRYESMQAILRKHGEILQESAPFWLNFTLTRAAHQAFLCGKRRQGLTFLRRSFEQRPSLSLLPIGLIGMLGPQPTAWATLYQRHFRRTLP